MSERKEEPTSKGSATSLPKESPYEKATELDLPKSKAAAKKVASGLSQSSRTRKRRPPLVDAAKERTVIDAEEDVAGIKRKFPLIDAAKFPDKGSEPEPVSDSEDGMTDVEDVPDATLEEGLLQAIGLSVQERSEE